MDTYPSVAELVRVRGGTKPIETVLVANNGLSAVKCIRSIRFENKNQRENKITSMNNLNWKIDQLIIV